MNSPVSNALTSLSKITKIVVDTGDLEQIKRYASVDVTTNPSLILRSLEQGGKGDFKDIEEEIKLRFDRPDHDLVLESCLITFSVLLGKKILKIIPGRVSIEVPSCYSFDQTRTIELANQIIELFEREGISKERVLIKIASTWEGIKAAERLERTGIRCNLTLIFSFYQAQLCAESGVTLISPFVGRIDDWYQKNHPKAFEDGDPGVDSVKKIYSYFKSGSYPTEVMGASFRRKEQILALAGCDLLTISPALLEVLANHQGEVKRKLNPKSDQVFQDKLTETKFRWELNQDAMAHEKLAEGIRIFHQDFEKQKKIVRKIFLN